MKFPDLRSLYSVSIFNLSIFNSFIYLIYEFESVEDSNFIKSEFSFEDNSFIAIS